MPFSHTDGLAYDERYARRALSPRIVYAIPKLLAPDHQELHVLLDGSTRLPDPNGVYLDRDLLRAETPDGRTDARFQEGHAVPRHVEFHRLREHGVTAAAGTDT